MKAPTLQERTSGVLCHVTSLPGPHGSGDVGGEARAFVSFLRAAGQRWWQVLPVGPVGYGDSPYSASSAFAGSPLLIDLDGLGLDVPDAGLPHDYVDYEGTTRFREAHLRRAFEAFKERPATAQHMLAAFEAREAHWLPDYALFEALKRAHGGAAWTTWAPGLRDRDPAALARAREEHAEDVAFATWLQFVFDHQWTSLREAANAEGIGLLGDVPIFVAHDSADVWQHRELFKVDRSGAPEVVAGVPPDYFSKTGQRWGNPLYDWNKLAEDGYGWWVARFAKALARFDAVRLDHFIGFVRAWEVPANEPTALNGTWKPGPGRALFDAVRAKVGALPLVAEDLGAVTPEVTELREALGLPGIRLVQFAFGTDPQAPTFFPHAHPREAVVYTGTHDNDTSVGWFRGGPNDTRTAEEHQSERRAMVAYAGLDLDVEPREPHWHMMRLAESSVANTAIVTVQDLLGLGSEARLNLPGTTGGTNWRWRIPPGSLEPALATRLLEMTRRYGRTKAPVGAP